MTRVEEVTAAPEMLGGRVKTLHPRIHAGHPRAARPAEDDATTLAEHGIEPFDLVCVNLYPFTSVAGAARRDRGGGGRDDRRRRAVDAARRGEELRARRRRLAARRSTSVVLDELREHGEVSLDTRRELAAEAFATTAAYEAAIANWFGETEQFPEQLTLDVPEGGRPPVRREPAPGGGVLPRGRRAAAPALAASSSSAARSSRTTTSPTSRRAPDRCASSRCRPS